MALTSAETRLTALHAHYTALINAAVGAGRMKLVEELASAYQEEALELILADEDGRSVPGQVEILEIGGRPHRASRWPGPRSRFWRDRRGR
jgi:hypothetical protein